VRACLVKWHDSRGALVGWLADDDGDDDDGDDDDDRQSMAGRRAWCPVCHDTTRTV
jgi:hypothetical protein